MCRSDKKFGQLGAALLIAGVTILAYWPALRGQYIWDDNAHITKPELRSAHGLYHIWFDVGATQQYYPLLHSAFWIEYQLWADNTLAYHLTNLLQHLAAAGLVYLILKKLSIPGAGLAAAIFALHPVQVESVAWITEQKNTLSAIFYLSAMLIYLRFDKTRRSPLYAAALLLFVLGVMSKTVTATLPAALLVIFWWQRGKISFWEDVLPLLPWFAIGAVAGLFTAWVEKNLIGAEGSGYQLTILQRCLVAGRVIWFYLGNLIWPSNLMFIYPRWNVDPARWRQWLFPIAAVVVLILLWILRKKSRGPLAAWLFFVGTLFPVLGFFNVYPFIFSYVADHFQYLACLGMIVLAAAGITLGLSRSSSIFRVAIPMVLVAILATLTWRQSRIYGDIITLYQTTLDKNPDCWMADNNLAIVLADRGQLPEAIRHYQRALRLKPDFAAAENNLGNALVNVGRTQEAIGHFQNALRDRAIFPEAENDLAIALFNVNRLADGLQHFEAAVYEKPDDPEYRFNLAMAYARTQQNSAAIAAARAALELARSQGNASLANQVQAWLSRNGAGE
jgi:tetratricopeptide (TPR) repeat protein